MPQGDDSGKLARPLLLAGIGVLLVALAIGLNVLLLNDDEGAGPIVESAGPVIPPPLQAETPEPAPSPNPKINHKPPVDSPTFDVVRINPKGDTVMAGRARPGAKVVIRDKDQVLGEVVADDRGEWVFLPDHPLPPGSRELVLDATAPDGSTASSQNAVVMVVPEPGFDVAGRQGGDSGPLVVQVPRNGQGPSRVMQTPSKGVEGPRGLAIDSLDYTDQGQLSVGGRARPDEIVHLYLNQQFLGQTVTDGEGRWSLIPQTTIEPGLYTLRADAVDAAGKVLARIAIPFSRAEPLEALPGEAFVVVQPGNSLWRMARSTYGDGFSYTIIFDANQEQIKDPNLIYPGQVFALPVSPRPRSSTAQGPE
ncbi:LysM peptidoglycan-binding domain-containing protein [Magnetospira thiophila]